MEDLCKKKNPLKRGGRSQVNRNLVARNTDYVLVDERDMGDLLLFAKKYAAHLQYINFDGIAEGDWSTFFKEDVSILIALLSDYDEEQYLDEFNTLLAEAIKQLDELPAVITVPGDIPNSLTAFKGLFDYILGLAYVLDRQLMALPDQTGLKAFGLESIRSANSGAMRRLIGYYFAADQEQLVDRTQSHPTISTLFSGLPADDVLSRGLSKYWVNDPAGEWSDYLSMDPNEFLPVFGNPTDPKEVRIRQSFTRIKGIFEGLVKTITKIRNEAPIYLEETVNNWPKHEPHMALFLAFLKLYRFAQDHLNEMTGRHLEYYYKEVLRLSEKAAEPDQAHLIIELAKNTAAYALKKDSTFKAGKDNEGNPVTYVNTEKVALNKTQIAQLSAVYLDEASGRLYRSDIVNSQDGLGLDIEKVDGRWPAFGPVMDYTEWLSASATQLQHQLSNEEEVELVQQIRVPASVGFAVSSPLLFLKSGTRTIELTLTVDSDLNLADPVVIADLSTKEKFICYLSGEEGWLIKELSSLSVENTNTIKITIALASTDPAVLPFDPAIMEEPFKTTDPILKIQNIPDTDTFNYQRWKEIKIQQIKIHIDVDDFKDFILQSDLGRLDASKPFLPFGIQGKKGAQLILSSKEVFQKPLKSLQLDYDWDGLPEGTTEVNATFGNDVDYDWTIDYHAAGTISTILNSTTFLETNYVPTSSTGQITLNTSPQIQQFDYSQEESIRPGDQIGHIRVNLQTGFGYKAYQRGYTDAAIQLARQYPVATQSSLVNDRFWVNNKIELLSAPYSPTFKSMTLFYEAETTIDLTNREAYTTNQGQFFQLGIFGLLEEHAFLRKEINPTIYLFPQYRNEGEFYIGLEGLAPPQNLNVLIQVAEGTADPLLNKEAVQWYYLQERNWVAFESDELADATNGLIQSGIVQYAMDRKSSDQNPWMPQGMHWIRASVEKNSKALCQLIALHAQATLVEFKEEQNAADFLADPLPAESIAKLVKSNSNVKKIKQPYTSFGGRLKEPAADFYRRISERLRHKERAINIWDYEHLILEAFPELYKVKCLNHTKVLKDNNGVPIGDQEIAPGYVTIVCLPDQRKRNAIDPLKPYTSLATLEAIKNHILDNKMTLHLELEDRLEVQNPSFEEIRLEFFVTFHPGLDKSIYQNQLNQDLIEFMSPWAYDPDAQQELEFGGSIAKSVLIDFIEERPYVDFITHVRLWHLTSEYPTGKDVETASALTSRSILVSHPKHLIKTEEAPCE
ncbi:MAG: hypothetical protein AAF598_02425 [Bacteroidota bacterium]